MAVEIRQMVVKSSVVQRQQLEGEEDEGWNQGGSSGLSSEDMKMILAECRHLVLEVLREVKGR